MHVCIFCVHVLCFRACSCKFILTLYGTIRPRRCDKEPPKQRDEPPSPLPPAALSRHRHVVTAPLIRRHHEVNVATAITPAADRSRVRIGNAIDTNVQIGLIVIVIVSVWIGTVLLCLLRLLLRLPLVLPLPHPLLLNATHRM